MDKQKLKPGDHFKVAFRAPDNGIRPDWLTYKGFWLTVITVSAGHYKATYNPEDNNGIRIIFPAHEYSQLEELNWKPNQDFVEVRINGAYPESIIAPSKSPLPDI